MAARHILANYAQKWQNIRGYRTLQRLQTPQDPPVLRWRSELPKVTQDQVQKSKAALPLRASKLWRQLYSNGQTASSINLLDKRTLRSQGTRRASF
jgi:hypothetical protein